MPLRCLVVDDSHAFLTAATRLLERGGMCVVGVASTGAEAIRQAAALRPDVVLVDVFCGAESGIDVARGLRDAEGGRALTVILISTYSRESVEEAIAQSGLDVAYISKRDLSAAAVGSLVERCAG
jgi:two-component system, NarL family, nitrate/nitrite response regulator NarL